MKKPRLCLALSASLALLQANWLPALSEPACQSIWQKLASVSGHRPVYKAGNCSSAKAKTATQTSLYSTGAAARKLTIGAFSAHGVAGSGAVGQSMLFLKSKEMGLSSSDSPAAALSIHPSMPVPQSPAVGGAAIKGKPLLIALHDSSSVLANGQAGNNNKQLIAQLAPDQIIAQAGGETGGTAATPISPVVSGTVDLEEFKPANVIDLKVSQSRTFKLRNKILRTSISDPSVAEPVVVSENQLVLLGKTPGGATLVIWDDSGNSVAVDVRVSRDFSRLQALLRQIDPRIVVQQLNVGGADRIILRGDVDHPESVIRAMGVADAFMDDRGIKIVAASSRIMDTRIGEQGTGAGVQQGGQTGKLSAISQVDRFLYFSNQENNVSKAQAIVSEGGRVTSLIRVRKVPLIVLHVTFLEMNTAAVRELGVQLGLNFTSQSFGFGVGGNTNAGAAAGNILLTSSPGVNTTQGSTGFPFAPGAVNTIVSPLPAPGTNLFTTTTLTGTAPVDTFLPAQQLPLGFLQQGMAKGSGFGATTAPVSYTAGNVIPVLLGNQIVNQPISAIGQGIPNALPPGLLSQAFLLGAPGGAAFTATGLANTFTSTSNFASGDASRWSINPTIQGVITHSRARILAEPTLVTISGERAAFLAGGEIPIPQNVATAGQSLVSVGYEPFGLRLNMIPVLMENGTINLQVSPEERLISPTLAFRLPGVITPTPGFTTRKTQTVVELKPGQELFISGLVSANTGRELVKTPIIGEVPVLGALYRSKAFSKNESELVVAVRPEIILPGSPGQLKLPEEISKVEGPRDTNMLQVEPTVIDERYMTSGRAEHSQRVPGELPPGSPVLDNQ